MFEFIKEIVAIFVAVITSVVMVFTGSGERLAREPVAVMPKEIQQEEIEAKEIPENKTEKQILETKVDVPQEIKVVEAEVPVPTPPKKTETVIGSVKINQDIVHIINTIPPTTGATLSSSEVNTLARNAIVNIICTTSQGGLLKPITGSGVIIDSRGVILTNAHIAQYYLLKDFTTENFLDCDIRTGSPARNSYKAKLLYISPSWVGSNYQKISQTNPKGTGEDDFALLLINETAQSGGTLPKSFPFVSPDIREDKPEVGQSLVVAGYPAGFLGGTTIVKELYAVSAVTQVVEIFTFKENSLDLFSIGGSVAAQKGSSGGAIVNFEGRLSGIVVTASEATQTEDRDLRAISLSHINSSIKKDTGADLNGYLFGDLSAKANQFNELFVPGLKFLLEEALTQ